MTLTRQELDEREAVLGITRPTPELLEAIVRQHDTESIERWIIGADIADRAKARNGLYVLAMMSITQGYRADHPAEKIPGTKTKCTGSTWCSRNADRQVVFSDGSKRFACWQHEDDLLKTAARTFVKAEIPEDEAGGTDRITDYDEHHESQDPREFLSGRLTEPVTVAEIWRRLAVRVAHAQRLVTNENVRAAFDRALDVFESKWGPVA